MLGYVKKFEKFSVSASILQRAGAAMLVLCSVLCSSSAISEEEYYTWVDENGVVNYSERNPAGYDARHVTPESRFGYKSRAFGEQAPEPEADTSSTSESGEEEASGGGDEIDPDQLIAAQKEQYEAELATERKRNCDLAKQNLARLETYARMRVKGDDGELRYLTASEMDQKKKETREAIKFHCR